MLALAQVIGEKEIIPVGYGNCLILWQSCLVPTGVVCVTMVSGI